MSPDVRQRLEFTPSPVPVTDPVTRFGGQPTWTGEPTWPVSEALGRPMQFLGQVALPPAGSSPARLALLFMTDEEGAGEASWEPESGENALLCSPGAVPAFLDTRPAATGPSVGEDNLVRLLPYDQTANDLSYVGGEPTWLQADETPPGFSFVFQLDETSLPFWVNFGGGGVGYAFVDHATGEGRFLWQST